LSLFSALGAKLLQIRCVLRALGVLSLVALQGGCAPELTEGYLRTCVLANDQLETFDGRWRVFPIPLAVQAGAFSEAEKSEIRAGAEQWNAFTKVSLGQEIFSIGTSGMPESELARSSNACSSPGEMNGAFANSLVIYKLGAWPYSSQDAIAITSTCPSPDTPIERFKQARIDLNYQFFFVTSKRPDLKSIITHELGHLLGLRHSCELSSSSGAPMCSDPTLNSNYLTAVMYPVFKFDSAGRGERRFKLNYNDQGRANCLYLPLFESN
jgi:hypothetical protein